MQILKNKQKILSKEAVEEIVEYYVSEDVNLTMKKVKNSNDIIIENSKRRGFYAIDYNADYDFYSIYFCNAGKEVYIGYVLTVGDLSTTIKGICQRWVD